MYVDADDDVPRVESEDITQRASIAADKIFRDVARKRLACYRVEGDDRSAGKSGRRQRRFKVNARARLVFEKL